MKLNEVRPARGAVKKRKRIGRGTGSGHGGTATKGHKGEQARAGASKRKSFEGGQMRLTRRIPKFGFTNAFRVQYQPINVALLQDRFEDGETVDINTLIEHGVLSKKYEPVKILGNGEISKKLHIRVDAISASARQKIEAAGGSVTLEALKPRQKRAREQSAVSEGSSPSNE